MTGIISPIATRSRRSSARGISSAGRVAIVVTATLLTLTACAAEPDRELNSAPAQSAAQEPSSPSASRAAATSRNSIGMQMVALPAGTFLMGAPADAAWATQAEKAQHEVRLTKPFALSSNEVTQEQWTRVMGSDPNELERSNSFGEGPEIAERLSGADHPATVSWEDAQAFIRRLNQREGGELYRLPTEAEWEYAARAGTTSKYSFGDDDADLDAHAWFGGDFATGSHHPVAQKEPNGWGLYDVHGNVWEWTQDRFSPNGYSAQPQTDPTGPASATQRTVRGGSWHATADGWSSTFRKGYDPDYRGISIGFRVARTATDASSTAPANAEPTAGATDEAVADVTAAQRQMIRGMLESDTDLLDELLDDSYTLEHITGYVQPKGEWLQDIEAGRMRYHSAQERSTRVEITGDTAVVVGRSIVDATIGAGRGTWNLQLTTEYQRIGGRWLALRTVATTF
jgi:formylglycine-generating enzyme required for sulfatase activity